MDMIVMWEHFWPLLPQLLVTFFGVFLAFLLDRAIDWRNRNHDKRDLLRDLHDELEETKGKLFPQTTSVAMLYPEVWDSAISSGQIRLLSSKQLRKLTKVYRFIKGTQYEAGWARRAIEEYNSVPETEKERRKWLEDRYKVLWDRHFPRGKQLSAEIDEILEEKWWDCQILP